MDSSFPEFQIAPELNRRPIDILALGSAILEQVVKVDQWPASGGQKKVSISDITISAGGCAVNVACFAGRQNFKPAVVSCLGDGKYSQEIWDELRRSNVITQYIHRYAGHDGNMIIELTNQDGDWAVMDYLDPEIILTTADVPSEEVFRQAKVLHIDGYSYVNAGDQETVEKAFQRARAAGCIISVDGCVPAAEIHPDFMTSLFARADIVFANSYEALAATKTTTVDEAIKVFQTLGPQLCIIKIGPGGSYVITPERVGRVPAYPVKVVDTVAAGDAYIATCLCRLIQGDSLYDASHRGSAAGALACMGAGSLSSHFNLSDIDDLIEDHHIKNASPDETRRNSTNE